MSKFEKLLVKIISGSSDNNIDFEELRNLLLLLGFTERTTGAVIGFFINKAVPKS